MRRTPALLAVVCAAVAAAVGTAQPAMAAVRPVTGAFAVPFDTSVGIGWTDPPAGAYDHLEVRRATGTHPPTAGTGTLVAEVPAPGTSTEDIGLMAGRTYSYAIFAVDAVGATSPRAAITTTTLVPSGAVVRGRITSGGQPLAHVGVAVRRPGGLPYTDEFLPQTDSDGRYVVGGNEPGDVTVCFSGGTGGPSSTGYVPACVTRQLSDATSTSVGRSLAVGGAVEGSVVGPDGTGVAGAAVTAGSAGAISDATGAYRIVGLPRGTEQVCATASDATGTSPTGYLGACGPTVQAVPATTVTASPLSLPVAGAMAGTITDTHGVRLPAVDVTVQASDGASYGATTDTRGRYDLTGLPGGSYTVCFGAAHVTVGTSTGYVDRCWHRSAPVTVTEGATRAGVSAALADAAAVSGTVLAADGSVAPGISVVAVGPVTGAAESTSTGAYAVSRLTPGDYQVCAYFDDGTPCQDVTLTAGEALTGIDLQDLATS